MTLTERDEMAHHTKLTESLLYWSRRTPDAVAVETLDGGVTWRQLALQVEVLAGTLVDGGVRPGDRLGYLCENNLDLLRFVLATFVVDAVAVPLNIRLAAPELAWIVRDAGVSGMLVDATYAELAASVTHDSLRLFWSGPHAAAGAVVVTPTAPPGADTVLRRLSVTGTPEDRPAIISYTSGTTGRPKGAVLSHDNLVASARAFALTEDMTRHDRSLLVLPLAFTGSLVAGWFPTIQSGATLVLHPGFDKHRTFDALVHGGITVFTGVPVVFEQVAALEGFDEADLSCLRVVRAGGAGPSARILRRYTDRGLAIGQGFGMTESTGAGTSMPHESFVTKAGSAGTPMPGLDVRILGGDGQEATAGETGEILLRGPTVMTGYLNNSAATAATIVDGWLHTGDVGRLDEDGYLWVVGREKEMILSGGLNVYPGEIERVLLTDPSVQEVAVVGVPDEQWGEVALAVVVGEDVDLDELRALCRRELAGYKVPRHFRLSAEPLPRTMSGKIAKAELADWGVAPV